MAAAFERKLEDNTCWYRLYPLVKPGRSHRDVLNQYVTDAFGKIAKHLTGYIWQNEPFNLHVVEDAVYQGPHIEGYTCYGDNVEDEWFIVFLLMQLTKSDPELVVKVEDSDGEFLLIEAADCLPKWADPENCENRVYLCQSEVHLIPIKKGPIPCDTPIIPEAVKAIRSHKNDTKCTPNIQATIQARIKEYPANIVKLQHRTKCYVSAAVATILDVDPTLISAAVGAFNQRDPIDMKACRAMKYFPPEHRVMKTVTMTRCMYGQLMGQKYSPDKKVGWEMPPTKSSNFKAYDLGMKIACGFEILAASAKPSQNKKGDTMDDEEELEEDYRWQRYYKSLEANGYFQELLKGSVKYTKLLNEAKSFYLKYVVTAVGEHKNKTLTARSEIGRRIMDVLDNVEIDYEKLENESKFATEDDDKWMNMSPTDFDELLKQKFFGNPFKEDDAQVIPDSLKTFMKAQSGIEGIVPVPPPRKNKPNGSSSKTLSPTGDSDATSHISFEPENFADTIRSVLSMKVPQTDSDASSSSGMSDYSDQSLLSDEEELFMSEKTKDKPRKKGAQIIVNEMKDYMKDMDRELAETKIGESFELKKPPLAKYDEDEDGDDEYDPVDVDLNAIKNIMESIRSQGGLPGPSSTILQSLGVHPPKNAD
ncbi:Protein ecdysoneless -like protein [Halotydeus destructor]|nr:Protein ecdysoneless -like protein [Halotydeus destructor]